MNLAEIQRALRDQALDGWLFFDHHRRDPLAYRVLGFHPEREITRRWYYLIPAEGEPSGLVHRIEAFVLEDLPGEKRKYSSWTTQVAGVRDLLSGRKRVAMQYSPSCAIPYVSMVDAGTLELVRGTGVEVVSSADLVQLFEARWNVSKLESHLEASARVDEIRRRAFQLASERINSGISVDDWGVRHFILDAFSAAGLVTDSGPIVAVNANAANPHYEPAEYGCSPIRRGDVLLIDLWAKLDRPDSVYYDVTWMGYCGPTPPTDVQNVFDVVRGARDRAIQFVQRAVAERREIRGFEVDDAARGFIAERGYSDFFVHRTGHSIGTEVHGAGANMDNLETHDERTIIPWTCFSIEPGVYLRDFGIRSEINLFVDEQRARVTGEIQERLVAV